MIPTPVEPWGSTPPLRSRDSSLSSPPPPLPLLLVHSLAALSSLKEVEVSWYEDTSYQGVSQAIPDTTT